MSIPKTEATRQATTSFSFLERAASFIVGMVTPVFSRPHEAPPPGPRPVQRQVQDSCNLLERIHQVTFGSLTDLSYKGRKVVRKDIANRVLEKGRAWPPLVNWRQVALKHCPGIILRTSFEGGSEDVSVEAARHFVHLCLEGEGLFFGVDISRKVFLELNSALENFSALLALRPSCRRNPMSKEELEKSVDNFLGCIRGRFHRFPPGQKIVYLPLGYRHGVSNQGHAMACKLVEEENHIVLHFFNLGNGSQIHPIVDYKLSHKETSFSFFPLRIPKAVFFGWLGRAAFCHLFRYFVDPPRGDSGYDANDIYGIFLQFLPFQDTGELVADLGPKAQEYGSVAQFSGTCPETAVLSVMKDVLIRHGVSARDIKKLLASSELCSLIAAYHSLLQNPDGESYRRVLIHDAIQSFGANALDMYARHQITELELTAVQAVVHTIVKATRPSAETPQLPEEQIGAPTAVRWDFDPLTSLSQKRASARAEKLPLPSVWRLEPPRWDPTKIRQLPEILRNWRMTAASLPPREAFEFVSDCVRVLPVPVRLGDVWNLVPAEAVQTILADLESLVFQGLQGVGAAKGQWRGHGRANILFKEQFMLIYTAIAIADKLARACEETKLAGYRPPFLPPPFTFDPARFTALQDAEDNRRFTALQAYFTGKKNRSEKIPAEKVIFPVAPFLNVQEFVSDHLSHRHSQGRVQGRDHISYLAKILPKEAEGWSEERIITHCLDRWMEVLPPQVQSLYYFVFLSHVLFFHPGKAFPRRINWAKTQREGARGLEIKGFKTPDSHFFNADGTPKLEKSICDPRFLVRGNEALSHQYRYYDFIDLFKPEVRALTTNEALCYKLQEEDARSWGVGETDLRTVLYMTRKANLGLWQALQEFSCPDNYLLLSHPGVQEAIDFCFFQPQFLLERLEMEPRAVIRAFRKFVRGGLDHYAYNTAQLHTILFLLREGICFESFISTEEDQEELFSYYRRHMEALLEKPLSSLDREALYMHLILLETSRERGDPLVVFPLLFEQNLPRNSEESSAEGWMDKNLRRWIRKNAYRYEPLLAQKEPRNAICRAVVTRAVKNPALIKQAQGDWEGVFPQFQCGDLLLNFFDGTILHKKYASVLTRLPQHSHFFPSAEQNELFEACERLFWKDPAGRLVSLDETLLYCPQTGIFEKVVSIDSGPARTYPLHSFTREEEESSGQDFLHSYYNPSWVHYQTEDHVITTYDRVKKTPYLRIERMQDGRTVYTRLSEAGPLPYKLVNLAHVIPGDRLYPYTHRYVAHSRLLCFLGEEGEIEELNFYHGGLQFVREASPRGAPTRLASAQKSGFYLVATADDLRALHAERAATNEYEELRQEINDFESAFTLYNPETKKWMVLFPHPNFEQSREEFSSRVTLGGAPHHYHEFEFDPILRCLKGKSQETSLPNICLALLFKMQRDYDKAYKYLRKVKETEPFDEQTRQIFYCFHNIKDHSIASIAFNLQISLMFIRNHNLIVEEVFSLISGGVKDYGYRDYQVWAMDNYISYCNQSLEGEFSRVTENLRLTDGQKKRLLLAFRDYYQRVYKNDARGWQEVWETERPVLHAQYLILFHPQREDTLTPRLQKIPVRPYVFSSLEPPEKIHAETLNLWINAYQAPTPKAEGEEVELEAYPIQISRTYLVQHFPELYERARSCRPHVMDRFDFILHSLLSYSDGDSFTHDKDLRNLLFYVRHFPHLFSEKTFSLRGITPQNAETFRAACTRIIMQAQGLKMGDFEQRYLRAEVEYLPQKQITLAAPRREAASRKIKAAKVRRPPEDLRLYLHELEREIYVLFHSPYKLKAGRLTPDDIEQETLFLLKRDSAQILSASSSPDKYAVVGTVAPMIMREAILKNNLAFLLKHRPELSLPQMRRLCHLVREWYHVRMMLQPPTEEGNIRRLRYKPHQFPEIPYFYLQTETFPRQRQRAVYQWVMQGVAPLRTYRNRHFCLPAGEGKTTVINPLLNLGAEKAGLMAVTCVTQAIYTVDKENLGYTLCRLEKGLYYLEVGMHMINRITAVDLEFIYSQLKQYKSEGNKLIINRHTFDALFLIRQVALIRGVEKSSAEKDKAALKQETGGKIRWAHKILRFFKEETLLLCDESHRNGDPFTRAIYGVGEFYQLSKEEGAHLLQLMKPLLGCYPEEEVTIRCAGGDKSASEIARLKDNLESCASPEEVSLLQQNLAKRYLKTHFPSAPLREFIPYLTDEKVPEPALLQRWAESADPLDKQKAGLMRLTGHFLLSLLPDFIPMGTDVDHGRSLYPERRYEVPSENTETTTAEWSSPWKTAVMTIKATYDRGLSYDDMHQMLTDMIKAHCDEQRRGFTPDSTPSNQKFQEWVKDTALRDLSLHGINLSEKETMRKLYTMALRKNPGAEPAVFKESVLEYFLQMYSFQAMGTPSLQTSCTTTDFFAAFRSFVAFSATPWKNRLAQPYCLDNEDYYDCLSFEPDVKRKLLEEKNQRMILVNGATRFFEEMQASEEFQRATIFLDPRGFFIRYPSKALAQKWLDSNPSLDGVLFFQKSRIAAVNKNKKLCLLLRSGEMFELKGSDIVKALKSHDLDWEKMRLGTMFDPAATESTNILQKDDAVALLFLGDGLTMSRLVQTVMRMRGFLTKNQTVVLVASRDLSHKIGLQKHRLALFDWLDKNEQEQEIKRVILNAFQEISFAVALEARQRVEKAIEEDLSPEMQAALAVYEKHAAGFVEPMPRSAYEAFGARGAPEKSRLVLERFAQQLYAQFNYELLYKDNLALVGKIDGFISRVEREIPAIHARAAQSSSQEVERHQQMETHTQREQQNLCSRPAEPLALDGKYGETPIYSPEFLKAEKSLARELFATDFLTTDLYFVANQMRTAKVTDGIDLGRQHIKPIHFYTILLVEGHPPMAWVDSNEIVATDQDRLITCPEKVEGLKHTAFIVNASGEIVQEGMQAIAPRREDVDAILQGPWMEDLIIDAALLRGRIPKTERFLRRIQEKGWKSFDDLWKKIQEGLPSLEHAHVLAYEELKRRWQY